MQVKIQAVFTLIPGGHSYKELRNRVQRFINSIDKSHLITIEMCALEEITTGAIFMTPHKRSEP